MKKALVLGEDTRSFLSVIRSLGQAGISVDVVCYDQTSPALQSSFVQRAWHYNYQAYTQDEWLENIVTLINEQQYDVVMPCDERAIFPLHRNRQRINGNTRLALPNQEVLDHLFDKHKTKVVAQQCGVNVAKGELHILANEQYAALSQAYGSKFVIKPTESFNEDKLAKRNKVAIVSNQAEFDDYLKHNQINDDAFLIESYFTGIGEGVSLFACNGKVQYLFAHTRVNEPRSGGGSSYRKAIPVDYGMAEACVKICEATQYDGVGMFEFKHNTQTGDWILVEVNARFWGSLPLAIHAGIDFPLLYAQHLMGEYTPLPSPNSHYNMAAHARSFTSDIYDMRAEMQYLKATEGIGKSLLQTSKRLSSFYRLFTNEKIDSYQKGDAKPFTKEVIALYAETIGQKLQPKLPKARSSQQQLMNALIKQLYVNEGQGKLLFVCYGNIMRSPLAAAFTKIFVANTQLNFKVDSYGFHQNENRSSPDECITAAEALGLDLAAHKSKWLRQPHISNNDIIFVFDHKNENLIRRYYQAHAVFNLAHFVPKGLGCYDEIADPYGRGQHATNQCYLLIIEALKHIFETYLILNKI